MKIKYIQKHTFIDYPGKIACTIFLSGCNLRCGFCHNAALMETTNEGLTNDYVLKFLEQRKEYLEGVCFTGGEPLLTLDIKFVKKIKQLGYKIKIDTNGTLPEKLKEIIQKKLVDYVAMDIKSSEKNYNKLTKRKVNLNLIKKSITLVSQLPYYEFRTTIIPGIHDEKEITKMKDMLLKTSKKTKLKAFYLQAFNARPGQMNESKYDKMLPPSDKLLNKMKDRIKNNFEICEIRN